MTEQEKNFIEPLVPGQVAPVTAEMSHQTGRPSQGHAVSARSWPVKVCGYQKLTGGYMSYFGPFWDLQRIIDLKAQIANCAL